MGVSVKRWVPVRALVGTQGHQAGHQKKEKLVELATAGEFGQVLHWAMKTRRCQAAEVSQWEVLKEAGELNTEAGQSTASALRGQRRGQKIHLARACRSRDLSIWAVDFTLKKP